MQRHHREQLKRLVEIYSVRTRELSEAISILGEHVTGERHIDKSITEIRRLSRLVDEAGLDLFAFVEPPPNE